MYFIWGKVLYKSLLIDEQLFYRQKLYITYDITKVRTIEIVKAIIKLIL